jgi:serine/threonine-protein kinase haspin
MPLKPKTLSQEPTPIAIDQPVYGVKVTLIDLGLARMDAGDGAGGVKVHWTPFAEEIFMGEGNLLQNY